MFGRVAAGAACGIHLPGVEDDPHIAAVVACGRAEAGYEPSTVDDRPRAGCR
jgi:hypothetical protein